MKQVECDVIKDLLPSYIDKVSSDTTNNLVEQHLKKCKDCATKLKEMNEEIDIKPLYNQKEQIDYLKGYRKNKIMTIIFVIILTIDIIVASVIAYYYVLKHVDIFLHVEDIEIGTRTDELMGEEYFTIDIQSKKWQVLFNEREEIDDNGNKTIYLDIFGKLDKSYRTVYSINVKELEKTNKICFRDLKGNVREIWSKEIKEKQ